MNNKENWLIAWSIVRTYKNNSHFDRKKNKAIVDKTPRQPKEINQLLKKARMCLYKKDVTEQLEFVGSSLNQKLSTYLRTKKDFKIEWTGWKYTWVKIEESDVPF